MFKKLMIITIVTLSTCLAYSSQAQTGLPLHLKKGDKYLVEYKTNATARISGDNPDSAVVMSTENILGTVYEIISVNNNLYQIKATYMSLVFKAIPPAGTGAELVQFDSGKPEDLDGEMGEAVKEVVGKSLVFTFDATTKKMVSVDEDPGIEPQRSQGGPAVGLFFFNEDALRVFAPKIFGGDLPADAKLEVGYKWDQNNNNTNGGMETKVSRHSSITKIEASKLFITIDQTVTVAGSPDGGDGMAIDSKTSATGKKTVDQATGLLIESRFDEKGLRQMVNDQGKQNTETNTITILTVKKV
ncbi:hypothetical protein [Solitalea lacus]|uniref:hypothetical protein n=1 Tax=Solitalea lacus TaxID=2911172 RepID=UPI001EDA1408|nr:hypothetical protein [Solitalea lacus]UKJ06565.1 hypothetical protein L2B55_13625 [Solitalea lacus]